jgi:hypothetical protein
MIVAIHQPNYLPYYGYFHKIKNSDIFVFLDTVTFSKNSLINRNKINTEEGPKWITVPVINKGLIITQIKDILINQTIDWRIKHWNVIKHNYKNCKGFNCFSSRFQDIYKQNWINLINLNTSLIKLCCNILKIETNFIYASSLSVQGAKSDLILNICKTLGADIYLSGPSGRDYLDETKFKEARIKITYNQFKHPQYSQPYPGFISNLSIIDAILNNENPACLI